jgi:hypothetical protein
VVEGDEVCRAGGKVHVMKMELGRANVEYRIQE